MELITAKTAGFCFGVSRGMGITENALKEGEAYSYGPLIHNSQVVKKLDEQGLHPIMEEASESGLPNLKGKKVIIRSHGVSRKTVIMLESHDAQIVDATCPFVKKIHKIVENEGEKGNIVVIVGNSKHPEIVGINGWSVGETYIIEGIEDAENFNIKTEKEISIVVQTTFNKNKFKEIVEIIKKKGYHIIVYDTICSATKNRQNEAEMLSKDVDMMLVIGDRKSSNTLKLYEICRKNCKQAYHIESANDIDEKWFKDISKIGITAGASTPKYIIEEVQNYVRIRL